MNHKLCCIGYITRDKIVTPGNTVYMPGGTAFYFAKAVSRLQAEDFLLVTALAEEDRAAADDITNEGIEVKLVPTAHSHSFENIYGDNPNDRRQRVTAQADPFCIEDLKDVQADIIHLGTLLPMTSRWKLSSTWPAKAHWLPTCRDFPARWRTKKSIR